MSNSLDPDVTQCSLNEIFNVEILSLRKISILSRFAKAGLVKDPNGLTSRFQYYKGLEKNDTFLGSFWITV